MELSFSRSVIAYAMLEVKYDRDGNFLWAVKSDGTDQNTLGEGIAVDLQGNSFITGTFSKNTSFGSTTLSKDSGYAVFITKLDSQGKFLWAKQTGANGNNSGNGIGLGTSDEIFVVGGFSDTAAFDSKILISAGVSDVFIAKLIDALQIVNDPRQEFQAMNSYPNPADRSVHFLEKQNVKMFDVLGREVLRCHDCDELNVENIPSGSYYLNGQLVIIHH